MPNCQLLPSVCILGGVCVCEVNMLKGILKRLQITCRQTFGETQRKCRLKAAVKTGSTAETARDVLIRQCEEVKLAKVNLVQVKLTSQLILIM